MPARSPNSGRLIDGLREAYQLDRVMVLLKDPQHEVRHLATGENVGHELLAHVRHEDRLDAMALALGGLAKPWLGSRLPAEAVRALRSTTVGGSYAFLPLPRADLRLGVLVFESRDPGRFTADLASDFLAHLGVVAAICLENAINRARLTRTGVTDFLTGYHNRRYLNARLRENPRARSGPAPGRPPDDRRRSLQADQPATDTAGDIAEGIARRIACRSVRATPAHGSAAMKPAVLLGALARPTSSAWRSA